MMEKDISANLHQKCLILCNKTLLNVLHQMGLRQNPPDFGVTSGQKPCTKIIYIVLQTSVGLF